MKTMRVMEAKQCAICERTLLVGERPLRFAPDGMDEYVEVCVLCQEVALDHGWVREGSPLGPAVRHARRRRPLSLASIFGDKRRPATEDDRRRARPAAAVERPTRPRSRRARLFNASDAVRTVDGISRSLGEPQASVVVLSGPNPEVVVTLAWDISWYQYRVSPDADAAGSPGRARPRAGRARREVHRVECAFRAWDRGFSGSRESPLDLADFIRTMSMGGEENDLLRHSA